MTGSAASSSAYESGGQTGASLALIFGAAGWGVLSAASLVIGAVIGVVRSPPRTVSAVLMAYGSGALIEALSIELFAHIVHMSKGERTASGEHPQQQKEFVYLAIGMAVFGGMTFAGMNKFLNDAGGWARKVSTLKSQVLKRRLLFDRMLANKLKAVPMFEECLSQTDLQLLASKMFTDVFEHGEVLFYDSDVHSPIYFLLYGTVRMEVFHEEEPDVFEHLNLGPKLAASPNMYGDKPAPPLINQIDLPPPPLSSDVEMDTRMEASSPLHQTREVVDSYLVKKNQLFGEMALFMGDSVPTQAVAVTDCKVLKLHFHEILDLMQSNPKVLQYLAREAARGIGRTPLFEGCTESTLDSVVACMARDTFEAEEIIFDGVDVECPIYYLVLGKVELIYPADREGEEQRRVVRPTSLFGTDHLISGNTTRVKATALDRTLALCIERSDLQRILDENQEFNESVMKVRVRAQSKTKVGGDRTKSSPNNFTRDTVRRASKSVSLTPCSHTAAADLGWEESSTSLCRPNSRQAGEEDNNGRPCGEARKRGRRSSKGGGPIPELIDITDDGLDIPERLPSKRMSLSFMEATTHCQRGSLLSEMEAMKDLPLDETGPTVSTEEVMNFHTGEPTAGKTLRSRPSLIASADPTNAGGHSGHPNSSHAAVMIWLGILIDAVPESVVLGILASTASTGMLLTFVIGVFLSNLPEAMSSSGTMASCGIPPRRILLMWSSIVVLTGVGAGIGAAIFPPGSETNYSTQLAIAAIEGMCGGAMLTMIANTALPEAFEQGGDVVGFSCLAGFLSALFVSVAAS